MIDPVRPQWRKSRRSGTGDNCVEIAYLPGVHAVRDSNWRKSSHSSPAGENCVEIAYLPGMHAVRDSKNPGGGVLTFDAAAWDSFIVRIKRGELDR